MMTQSSQQPLASHCKDKLTRSNTSNEHAIQGTSGQRTPTRNSPTPTHQVQSRENQTGQCCRHKTELAAFITQGGTRHQTSIGSNGPRFWQDDELPPVKETPKIQQSMDNIIKFGRLASGVGGRVKGTKKIRFIHQDDVPQKRWKDITYGSFQCNVRPEKIEEPNRT